MEGESKAGGWRQVVLGYLWRILAVYLYASPLAILLAASFSMPLSDVVERVLQTLFVAYFGSGLFFLVCVLLLRSWVEWLLDRTAAPAYRAGLGLVALGTVALFCLGSWQAGIALACLSTLAASVVALSRRNSAARSESDGDWEEAEKEFWRRYATGEWPWEEGAEAEEAPSGLSPWEVLGLSPGATKAEIRSAYRAICKACHPDANGGMGDAERFWRATEAYHSLFD